MTKVLKVCVVVNAEACNVFTLVKVDFSLKVAAGTPVSSGCVNVA